MVEEVILDVCDLEPPEPYELATSTLGGLQAGQYVRLIIPRQPRLLYPWLEENDFKEVTRKIDEDMFEIYIWFANDTDTEKEINKLV